MSGANFGGRSHRPAGATPAPASGMVARTATLSAANAGDGGWIDEEALDGARGADAAASPGANGRWVRVGEQG
jgi:hypothetical protein